MEEVIKMQNQLDKVHRVQLEIALEVKRICDLYNIKYFLIAGTLLGAVRHGGFIPWDDDMDIGMLREDYEKFISIAKTELSSKYVLQTWDEDINFGQPFAKIRKNGTRFVEKNSSKVEGHKGIYIDIFPFDNVPENLIARKVHSIKIYLLKRLILSKLGYEVWLDGGKIKKIIYKFLYFITKFISISKMKKFLEKEMKKYNTMNTDLIVAIGGSYGYKRESIKREWIEDLTTIKFENIEFLCPKDFHSYLTHFYGDYMKPPPENKRYNRHGIIEIDFGSDEE
jgi:lipopolysaccharide cholinephosphotransferase